MYASCCIIIMCLCLTNSSCFQVSRLVPGLAQIDVKRGWGEVEKLRTKERWKTHEGRRKRNKEETRKRKEYISVRMNYSDVSKKQPHYWCCCALVSSILTFFLFWIFHLNCNNDLIFHGLVTFHDPKTRSERKSL